MPFAAFEDAQMSAVVRLVPIVLLMGALQYGLPPQTRGETVEEIVAWVDDDIITKVDLERQERKLIEAARQQYSGDELKRRIEAVRRTTLLDIIDHTILHHRGQLLWGAEDIERSYLQDFRQQHGLSDDKEFEQLLAREGLTVERLKRMLSERIVPEQLIEQEVAALMPGVSDLEARDYCDRHPDEFMETAEASPDGSRLEKRLIPFDESLDRARKALQHERYLEQLEEFVEMARGEADWWVKAEYRDHLPEGIEPTLEEAPW
jgi:hypothetical protein